MDSLAKVAAFVADLQGPPSEEADALELTIKTVLQMGAPMLDSLLPDDPLVLDAYLEHLGRLVLDLRSDDSQALVIEALPGVIQGEVIDEDEPRQLEAGS